MLFRSQRPGLSFQVGEEDEEFPLERIPAFNGKRTCVARQQFGWVDRRDVACLRGGQHRVRPDKYRRSGRYDCSNREEQLTHRCLLVRKNRFRKSMLRSCARPVSGVCCGKAKIVSLRNCWLRRVSSFGADRKQFRWLWPVFRWNQGDETSSRNRECGQIRRP